MGREEEEKVKKEEDKQDFGAQKGNMLQSTSILCCSWAEGLWDTSPP